MAANSWRNTSFGLDQNSTKSNRKAKHGARRKGLFALSAAAGAVGFIGLSPHAAKADVLANLFATVIPNPANATPDGEDTFLDDPGTVDWYDLSSPTVDNPANSTGFPGSQDIAQFDSIYTNLGSVGGSPLSALPTFSFLSATDATYAGINVNSAGGTAQVVLGTTTFALTVVIGPNFFGTPTFVLGNAAFPGAGSAYASTFVDPNGNQVNAAVSVVGTNGLSINLPVSLATSQTWAAGIVINPTTTTNATTGQVTVSNTAIGTPFTETGNLALNGHALTLTGGSDGTGGNFTLSGNISDGVGGPGSIVMNSAQGTVLTTQTTLAGVVTSSYNITAGTATLSGSNTFTGGITLVSGQVTVSSLSNTGGVNSLGGPIDFKGGFLGVGGTTLNNLNANSVNGNPAGATATWTGVPVALNIGSTANPFTISQNLAGSSSVQKTGPGSLFLTGTNDTYTGGTTIIQGTIIAPSFQALGNNSGISGAGGAVVNYATFATTGIVAPATYLGLNTASTVGTLQLNLPTLPTPTTLYFPDPEGTQTQQYSPSQAGTGLLVVGGGTLDLNATITNAGLGVTNNATLVLDYNATTATSPLLSTPLGLGVPSLSVPNATSGPLTGATLNLGGGTVLVNGTASSPLTTFEATNITGGVNIINDNAGVPLNMGFINYTTTGTVAVNATTGATTTSIVANNTINRAASAFGAVIEFQGPVTSGDVTPFQVLDNNTFATPLFIGASTGGPGTNGPAGTVGSIVQTPTNSAGTVALTGSYDTSYYSGYATYGLSDWAVVTPAVNGTSYIAPSSAVPGFFSQTNIGINTNPTAIQTFNSQGTNAPANYDIEGPGEPRFAGNHAYDTIRFNAPNGGLINVNGNDLDQFTIAPLMEGGAFLETPNVGANNLLVNDFSAGALSGVTTQVLDAGRNNGSGQDFVIWQNNTAGLMVWSTGIGDAGSGNPANGALTEAGPGTLVLDGSSSYSAATSIDSGTIEIQFSLGIGGFNAANEGAGTIASPGTNDLILNGGSLIANGSFALDNSVVGTGKIVRNVQIGAAGGNLTADGGDVFTVDGNIFGTGNLTVGNTNFYSVASANTHNSVVLFSTSAGVGLVVLSGNNTYSGNTTVLAGSLQADGSYTTGNFTVSKGATLSGVPSLPASSSVTVSSGGTFYPGDNGVGAFTVGTLQVNAGSSLAFAFSATSPVNPVQITANGGFHDAGGSTSTTAVNLYLFQEFTTSQYQNSGTYTLLQLPTVPTGLSTVPASLAAPLGTTAETSSIVDGFLLANPQILTNYDLSYTPVGLVYDIDLEISSKVFGATWNKTGGGTWDSTVDWMTSAAAGSFGNPPIPNGEVDTATFGSSITAPATITVDNSPNSGGTVSAITVGNIIFNSTNSYTINAGTSPNLTLTNGLSTATVSDNLGQHTINVPLVMTAGVNFEVNNPTDVLTIAGPITGTGGVNFVNGLGTLVLSNTNNSYTGPTQIASAFGVLQLGNGTKSGSLGNTQPFVNQGTLVFDQPSGITFTLANTISGTGGFIQEGTGSTVVLTGTNTFSGPTVVNASTKLQIGNAAAIDINGTVLDNGLIDMNGQPASLGSLSGAGTVDNVSAGGSVTLVVGTANTSSTFSGIIKNTSGTVSLSKQGSGTLFLTGINTYTGTTTIPNNGGYIELTASNSIPPTQTIFNDNQVNGALILGNGVTVANPIVYNVSAEEFIEVVSGGSAVVTGPISVSAGAAQFRLGWPGTGTITFTGPITDGTPVNGVPGTGLQNNVDGFLTGGDMIFTGNSALYAEPSIGFGRNQAGESGLTLLLEQNASINIYGTDGLKDATDTGGIDYGEGTNDPYVNVTVQDQASIYAGAGTIQLDTQTSVNITNNLTLNGGTVTAGALSWTPPTGSQGTSSAIVTLNGGVLIAGATTANFTPIPTGDATTANFPFLVGNGGALIDTNGFNIELTDPGGFLSDGSNGTDGGLTKLGAGELVFSESWEGDNSLNPNQAEGGNLTGLQGPINVKGGLLDVYQLSQFGGTEYIQVSAGGAVGLNGGAGLKGAGTSGTGGGSTLTDANFLALLANAPNPQAGALVIEPGDKNYTDPLGGTGPGTVNIDYTGSATGGAYSGLLTEGSGGPTNGDNTSGTTYVFNMGSIIGKQTNLLAMSIGAGSSLENGVITYNGTITPGRLNGSTSASVPYTYQLGGGGTLALQPVTFGLNATNGVPLIDQKVGTAVNVTNVLIENGGEIALPTTNTYTGTTTILGSIVPGVPAANLPGGVATAQTPITQLATSALFVSHLGDPGSVTGSGSSIGGNSNSFSAASNLVIDGGILGYIGAGDTSSRLFTIGVNGATLTANESGTIPLIFSNTGSLAFATDATNSPVTFTLNGTSGNIVPVGTVGTTTFVNVVAPQINNPTGGTLSLVVNGTNAWGLSNISNSYTGGTSILSGKLQVLATAPAGSQTGVLGNIDNALNIASGATLDLNGNTLDVGALTGAGTIDDITGGGTSILVVGNGNATSTFSGVVTNTSGTVEVETTGTGFIDFTGSNTYSGGTIISPGTTLTASSGIGTGPITDSGVLVIDDTTSQALANTITGPGSVFNEGSAVVTLSGSNAYSGGTTETAGTLQLGAINGIGTGALIVNGGVFDLNGFSPTVSSLSGTGGVIDNVTAGGTVSLTVNNTSATPTTYAGVIQNTTGTLGLIVAAGTLVLAGANTYGGGTSINGGALQIGAGGTTGSIVGSVVDATSLIINRSDTAGFTFGNSVSGAGKVSVTGTGTVTFTGANTYAGTTTVSAGTLVIGKVGALPTGGSVVNNSVLSIQAGSSLTPINPATITGTGTIAIGTATTSGYLSLGSTTGAQTTTTASSITFGTASTLNINNNTVVINYSAGNDPATAIRAALTTGYNGDTWTGTGIDSGNAAASPGLYAVGYSDGARDAGGPTTSTQVEIKTTLAGDANLDGHVNFADLLVVAQNYNKSIDTAGNPVDWADGDFNYDNKVNFADLLLISQNYSKTLSAGQLAQLPGSFAADWNLALAEVQAAQTNNVPEPATTALLALAAGTLLARRRRSAKNS